MKQTRAHELLDAVLGKRVAKTRQGTIWGTFLPGIKRTTKILLNKEDAEK